MSVESMSKALHLVDARLDPATRLLLVGIANHDGDGGAWPSIATLAGYVGVTTRSVQRHLAKLVELGYVTRHPQQGGSAQTDPRYRPNLYELHWDRGDAAVTPAASPGVTPVTPRGDSGDAQGVTPVSPEPSCEPSVEPSRGITLSGESQEDPNHPLTMFERFWQAYPRRIGKPDARRKFVTALNRHGVDSIRCGLRAWRAYWEEARTEQEHIPHPATWLHQERYMDTPPPIARRGRTDPMSDALATIEAIRQRAQADGGTIQPMRELTP